LNVNPQSFKNYIFETSDNHLIIISQWLMSAPNVKWIFICQSWASDCIHIFDSFWWHTLHQKADKQTSYLQLITQLLIRNPGFREATHICWDWQCEVCVPAAWLALHASYHNQSFQYPWRPWNTEVVFKSGELFKVMIFNQGLITILYKCYIQYLY